MNHLRKICCILSIVSLLLAVSASAMAADGSITVENPVADQSYAAYQIFDVTYNADGTSYAYTISADSPWFPGVDAYAGITLTKIEDESNGIRYVVSADESYNAAAFAAHLKNSVEGKNGIPLSIENGKAVATGVPLGYYFVTSSTGALCNLTTTTPSAFIYDKNDVPFEKTDDQEDVDVGQRVTYKLTGKVPSTTGFSEYTYQFADTMSDGLSFQDDVAVYVADAKLDADYYTYSRSGNGFYLSINVKALQDFVAEEIIVTYSAIVNENAVTSVEKNAATLEYSNDPTTDTTTTTPPEEETIYTSKIIVDKYTIKGEDKVALADAKFVLQNSDGLFYQYTSPVQDDPATDRDEAVMAAVNWVANQSEATEITTDENGKAEFIGLANGTYALIETKAPAGYNQLTDPYEIIINGVDGETVKLSYTAEIENKFGAELPETGGMGTTLLYILGSAFAAGAFIILITRSRIHTEK